MNANMTKDEVISIIFEILETETDEELNPETYLLDLDLEMDIIEMDLHDRFDLDYNTAERACMAQTIDEMASVIVGETADDEQVENDDLHIDERRMYEAIKRCLLHWSKKKENQLFRQLVIYNMDGTFSLYVNPGLQSAHDLQTGDEYPGIYDIDMFDEEEIGHVHKIGYRVASRIENDFPLKEEIDMNENFKVYTMAHDFEELRDDLREKANKLLSSSYEVFCEKF